MYASDPLILLQQVYGDRLRLHFDLYELSERHRAQHGPGCTVYPSSPANTPMWFFLAAAVQARRFLEIGCGLGYTAAVLTEAGGPGCRVDTVESVRQHADLAEDALGRRGLLDRITILRGWAADALPGIVEPYDIVFVDADEREYPALLADLTRLTRLGGVLVTANISPERIDWSQSVGDYLARLVEDVRFRTFIVPGFWKAFSYRMPDQD